MPRWPQRTLLERFWEKIQVGPTDACWPWLAGKNGDGFGVFWISRSEPVYAHRLALMLVYGPLPAGVYACHTCEDRYPAGSLAHRACCNAAHLYAGTHAENVRDCYRNGRHPFALRKPKALELAL